MHFTARFHSAPRIWGLFVRSIGLLVFILFFGFIHHLFLVYTPQNPTRSWTSPPDSEKVSFASLAACTARLPRCTSCSGSIQLCLRPLRSIVWDVLGRVVRSASDCTGEAALGGGVQEEGPYGVERPHQGAHRSMVTQMAPERQVVVQVSSSASRSG